MDEKPNVVNLNCNQRPIIFLQCINTGMCQLSMKQPKLASIRGTNSHLYLRVSSYSVMGFIMFLPIAAQITFPLKHHTDPHQFYHTSRVQSFCSQHPYWANKWYSCSPGLLSHIKRCFSLHCREPNVSRVAFSARVLYHLLHELFPKSRISHLRPGVYNAVQTQTLS